MAADCDGIVTSSAAVPEPRPRVPDADPAAIRAVLPPEVAAEFDRNWDAMMDQAKQSQDITLIHSFLARWRIMAAAENADPGSYFRLIEKTNDAVARMERGELPVSARVSADEVLARITARLDGR